MSDSSLGGVGPPAAGQPSAAMADWQVSKKEVVMTLEQAKAAKLAKGFALEPVRPGALDASGPLPEKRERKKADIFGYEDQQKQREEKHKENKPKPKPKPKHVPSQGNGVSAAPAMVSGISQQAAVAYEQAKPTVAVGPSPYEDRKRVLQERLRRIETQLKKLDRMGKAVPEASFAAASQLAPQHVPHSSHQQVASAIPPHMQAMPYDTPAAAGTKRRASEGGGGGGGAVKKSRSSSGSNRLGPKAEVIMSSLMENPASKAYFNKPVDPVLDGVPNYLEVISRPMDLGTIKKSMDRSKYETHEMWADDIRQVWANAMEFNAPGNDVHESAKNLSMQFEAYYKQNYKATSSAGTPAVRTATPAAARKTSSPAPGTASPAQVPVSSAKGSGSQYDQMQRQMEQMRRQLESVQKSSSGGGGKGGGGSAPKKKGGGGGSAVRRTMTFEEKRTLSLNINKLEHDKLSKVVDIIKKKKKVDDDEEIEIDIDSLTESTLRELEKYVNDCLNPKAAGKAGSQAGPLRQAAQAVVQSAHTPKRPPSDSESSSESSSSDSDDSDAKPVAGSASRRVQEEEEEEPDDDDEFSGGESSDSDGVRRKKKSGSKKAPSSASKKPAPSAAKPAAASTGGKGIGTGGKGGKGAMGGGGGRPSVATSGAGGGAAGAGPAPSAGAGAAAAVPSADKVVSAAGAGAPGPGAGGAAARIGEEEKDAVQEPMQKPQMLPTEPVRKPVQIENTAAWGASLMDVSDDEDGAASHEQDAEAGPGTSSLWSQFQNKDQLQKQREEEKRKEEEREKLRQEEDARRAREIKAQQERIRQEKQKEEEEEAARAVEEKRKLQEAQREAERAEREKQKQTVNMDAQLMLAKEVPVAGASLVAKDAASGASGITASMVAGLRGGESSDSSDSEDD